MPDGFVGVWNACEDCMQPVCETDKQSIHRKHIMIKIFRAGLCCTADFLMTRCLFMFVLYKPKRHIVCNLTTWIRPSCQSICSHNNRNGPQSVQFSWSTSSSLFFCRHPHLCSHSQFCFCTHYFLAVLLSHFCWQKYPSSPDLTISLNNLYIAVLFVRPNLIPHLPGEGL